MIEKGLVDPAALDAIIETTNTKSARGTARVWSPAPGPILPIKQRLLADATAAIAELGYSGPSGTHGRRRELHSVPQPGRLHPVLLLSIAGAGPAARLVQIGRLSVSCGVDRATSSESWVSNSRRYRGPGVRFDRGDPLPGAAEAPGRHGNMYEDGLAALVVRDAMIGVIRLWVRHEQHTRHGRHARSRPDPYGTRRAGIPCALGSSCGRAAGPLGPWARCLGCVPISDRTHAGRRVLRSSYYEKWLTALTALSLEAGLISRMELESGRPDPDAVKQTPALTPEQAKANLTRNRSWSQPEPAPARYRPGDNVRARNIDPTGHTRLPRYARGKTGTIERSRGARAFRATGPRHRGNRPASLPGPLQQPRTMG